ncbi:HAD family hydrolase [Parablautia intestinalis]|jgi:FMN phosphatase YigB (HAD superfamily)|uniref:HAD family hydrolase n=1 Tax=Parablautia intestinalis TaxID=2320100 RepID=UPI00259C838A|nr:HAD family phosphatase [Parablautia intestinalis]
MVKSMIKNIVFDIGNVLAGFAWQEFYLSFGFSEDIYEKLTKATIKSAFWNELDRGVLNDDELLEGFIRNDPSIEKEIREVFQSVEKMITRYDYAIPWVKELKDRGYGIYVISNFSHKAYIECADALDFLKETDGAILSFQEKLIKPMPEIYQLLTKRYGLKAQECVFIDDTAKNVDAAVKEGMKGIVFHTLEQVKTELEEMLTF